MQLIITHETEPELVLPINYHHILQSIIFKAIEKTPEYEKNIHDYGYENGKRIYKLFQFSLLKGKYKIEQKNIIFYETVRFEIRSIDVQMLLALKKYFERNGICYGKHMIDKVDVRLEDTTIEKEDILIKMKTPLSVHSTDKLTHKTIFYSPYEKKFTELVKDNFKRKYKAYTGKLPDSDIEIEIIKVSDKDKYVTNYKGFYISGWCGIYRLKGERKYLDFLYQTGLGDRNSQGFGMFDLKMEV